MPHPRERGTRIRAVLGFRFGVPLGTARDTNRLPRGTDSSHAALDTCGHQPTNPHACGLARWRSSPIEHGGCAASLRFPTVLTLRNFPDKAVDAESSPTSLVLTSLRHSVSLSAPPAIPLRQGT